MRGWKTWFAAGMMLAIGVYQVSEGNSEAGMARISEALAIVGIAHKIEKAGL